jgi:hypothetical protein
VIVVERAMREMLTRYRAHPRVLRALAEVSYYDDEVAAYWLGKPADFVDVEQRRLEDEQRDGGPRPAEHRAATGEHGGAHRFRALPHQWPGRGSGPGPVHLADRVRVRPGLPPDTALPL